MSIDKVEVTNSQGDLLTLTLDDPSNGYVVEDIGGLDPVKASIVSSQFATVEGEQYQASSRGTRNITITLSYAPDYSINETVQGLRSALYQWFMTGFAVTLTFYMSNGVTVTSSGRVESAEAPLFTAEPQMDISIICFDPDFIGVDLVELHTQFTTIDTTPTNIVLPPGTVKTGLTSLRFTAPKTLTEFTIYHTTPSGDLRSMLISAPLVLNDIVNICTVPRQKSITLTRTGITTSLLWAVSPQSAWILLEPGTNQFYMNASLTGPSAPVLVDYHNRYGGL